MTGDGILERMALGVIVVSSSGELWMLLKLQGSIGGYPTVAHVIIAGWSALTQLKTGEHRAIPFGEPEESHEALVTSEALLDSVPVRAEKMVVHEGQASSGEKVRETDALARRTVG